MRWVAGILLATLGASTAAQVARSVPPLDRLPAPVARPNPATFGLRVDYVAPLPTPTGGIASLPPLGPGATAAAYADQAYLHYRRIGDLGGFVPAPLGSAALSSGGRAVVGSTRGRPELPLFARAAGGGIESYTFSAGRTPPPDNGRGQVPGLGVPPVTPPPTPGNVPPPPNQGFGGHPQPPGTTTVVTPPPPPTTTRTTPPPPPTTTPTTTVTTPSTTTTTTAPSSTTTTPTTTSGGTTPADCGTAGISITSNLSGCRIDATNMAPGNATSETVTITNTSGSSYTLALEATGTQNQLWNDLRMGVYEQSTPAPSPLPPLLDWTTQYNDLTTLHAGESVTYVITLYLPTSAGNADQSLAAVIDFSWRATG